MPAYNSSLGTWVVDSPFICVCTYYVALAGVYRSDGIPCRNRQHRVDICKIILYRFDLSTAEIRGSEGDGVVVMAW